MKKNITIIALAIFVIINLIMNIMDIKSEKKIAYVRSQDLIYAYTGMQEMQLKFQDQSQQWENNLDTLKMEYQKSLSNYQQHMEQLNASERKTREEILYAQKNNLIQYSETIKNKSQEEEQKMLEGVLNQVNNFVEKYAINHNYDLILGTTLSGSILYGEETIDITQDIIKEININYEGK